jgi:hypothetical protein
VNIFSAKVCMHHKITHSWLGESEKIFPQSASPGRLRVTADSTLGMPLYPYTDNP